jgi:1-pyrroline-5-carboxylate dehydrogenase
MSFKLTYATMFDPPEELHQRFEAAMARVSSALGQRHPLHIAGEDRSAPAVLRKFNPANDQQLLGEFAAATRADADAALRAAHVAWPAWRDTSAAERARLLRRAGHLLE